MKKISGFKFKSRARQPFYRAGRKVLPALGLVIIALVMGGLPVLADSFTIDFESYTVGTVNGQDGWSSAGAAGSGCAVYDHAIVNNVGAPASFGSKSLRISNAVTSGCFSDQTFSKSLVNEAGETSAVSDGLSGGTRQNYFEAQWDFASTVPGAEQPGLSTVASPDRGDGARMSWVQMTDTPTGLTVNFNDYQRSNDPTCTLDTGFVQTTIASGLSRTSPHTIKVTMVFVNGPANDLVRVYVDGVLKHTGTSWEDYYRDCEVNPTRPVDSLLFRTGGAAAPATAGKGFLIDNLTLVSAAAPQCTTVCYVNATTGNDADSGATPTTAKKTIQAGINTVSPGGTVNVAAGTYTENLTISKAVTLNGAQAGVLAKSRPGAQSILKYSLPNQVAIDMQADNIKVDGFYFNMTGATTPWTIIAINKVGGGRFANINILNNEFVGNPSTGSSQSDPGGAYLTNQDNLRVEGNYFNNLGSHAIFLAGGNSTNAIYRNNDSFHNFLSNFSTQDTGTGHTNTLIENNRSVEDDMILFNLKDATIRNNSLTGTATSPSRVYLGGGSERVTVNANTISGGRSAMIQAFDPGFGYGPDKDITVTNNNLTINLGFVSTNGSSYIDFRDVGGTSLIKGNTVNFTGSFASGTNAAYGIGVRGSGTGTVNIADNELNGNNISSTGTPPSSGILIRSNTPTNGALPASAVINVTGNKLTGFTNAVSIYDFITNQYGNLPTGVQVKINSNSIAGNSAGVVSGTGGATADGTNNWWGSPTGPTNPANPGGTGNSVVGNVTFTPWLCDGTDTSAAIGFQPNAANKCGTATRLIFSTQPGGAAQNQPLNPQPVVKAVDAAGNLGANFNGPVTLTIGNNPSGGTLGGTTTVNAVNGVATFSGLSINKVGIGYTLVASASGLTSATSNPFNISDGTPPTTTATTNPASPGPSGYFSTTVAVTLTAVDNPNPGGSGVKKITYSATGAQTIPTTSVNGATTTFNITNNGVTTITYFAEDNAGNVEAPKTLVIKIDKTAPSFEIFFDRPTKKLVIKTLDTGSGPTTANIPINSTNQNIMNPPPYVLSDGAGNTIKIFLRRIIGNNNDTFAGIEFKRIETTVGGTTTTLNLDNPYNENAFKVEYTFLNGNYTRIDQSFNMQNTSQQPGFTSSANWKASTNKTDVKYKRQNQTQVTRTDNGFTTLRGILNSNGKLDFIL